MGKAERDTNSELVPILEWLQDLLPLPLACEVMEAPEHRSRMLLIGRNPESDQRTRAHASWRNHGRAHG